MTEEKRVKLGIDIGSLSQELLQINNLIEENYRKSLQGQAQYNSILEESVKLLKEEVELVNKLGENLQNVTLNNKKGFSGSNFSSGGSGSSGENLPSVNEVKRLLVIIDAARGANNNSVKNQEEALDNEVESRENDFLKDIKEDLDRIWEKFSEGINTPIPVEIKNVPLDIKNEEKGGKGGIDGEEDLDFPNNPNNPSRRGISGANAFNKAAGLVQQDPNYILAGLVGMIPVIGTGLAAVASKLIQEAEAYDNAKHRLRAAKGIEGGYGSFTDIGLKDADAFEKLAAYYSANVNLRRTDLLFEKGFNVSSGLIDSLLRAFREDIAKNIGASVVGVDYLQGLSNRSKIEWKEVRGYSEDYLKILIDLNQKQLETIGETNSLINGHIIQGIASLSNKFGDPTILSRIVGSIQNGLQQAKNPQLEALQYYALSQANPGASIWEMQLMKEDPFRRGRGYLSNYLEALLSTGNIEDVKFNVMNAFGLGALQTEELVNGLLEAKAKGISLSEYLETKDFGNSGIQITREKKLRPRKISLGQNTINTASYQGTTTVIPKNAWMNRHMNEWYSFLKGKGVKDNDAKRLAGFFAAQDGLESAGGTSAKGNNYGGMQRGGKNISYSSKQAYMENKWKMMQSRFSEALNASTLEEYATILGDPNRAGKHYLYYVTDKVKYNPKDPNWIAAQTKHMHNYINGMRAWAGKGYKGQEYKGESGGNEINSNDYEEVEVYKEKVTGNFSKAQEYIEGQALFATSPTSQMTATISNDMAYLGEPLISLTSQSFDLMGDVVNKINGYFNGESLIDDLSDVFNSAKDWLKDTITEGVKGAINGAEDWAKDKVKNIFTPTTESLPNQKNDTNPQDKENNR